MDTYWSNILFFTATQNDRKLTKQIIETMDVTRDEIYYALHLACHYFKIEAIKLLIESCCITRDEIMINNNFLFVNACLAKNVILTEYLIKICEMTNKETLKSAYDVCNEICHQVKYENFISYGSIFWNEHIDIVNLLKKITPITDNEINNYVCLSECYK